MRPAWIAALIITATLWALLACLYVDIRRDRWRYYRRRQARLEHVRHVDWDELEARLHAYYGNDQP